MNAAAQSNPMDARTVIAAAIMASAVGAVFYNVLPLYVGTAQDFKALDNTAVGFLTSSFFFGFNVVTASAFFWIRRISWRKIVAASAPVAALGLYAGTLTHDYASLLVSVAVSGGALAAIYGVGTTALADTSIPSRWFGLKIAVESLAGAAMLLLLPVLAISRWGFDGVVYGMLVVMAVLAPFLLWLPSRGSKGVENGAGTRAAGEGNDSDVMQAASMEQLEATSGLDRNSLGVGGARHWRRQRVRIWGAILATLTLFSGASAIWAFLERIGIDGGHDAATVGVLLSITLVFAVAGSMVAAALGGRFGNLRLFAAGAVAFAGAATLLGFAQGFAPYAAGACLFSLTFGFMIPIAVSEIAERDVDGRYVVLSVPAVGIGAMVGPGLGGLLTQAGGFLPLLAFAAGTALAACALMAFLAGRTRPHLAATG